MPTIVPQPAKLLKLAAEAKLAGRPVELEPDQVRFLAEMWHADREKVRYLESLIVRIGRNAQ